MNPNPRSPNHLPFGVSQFTTWPQSFEDDLKLYQELEIPCIELCEGKLDPDDPLPQLERLKASPLRVSSIQPRLHSLFPDAPRPSPESPSERMAQLHTTIETVAPHFPDTPLVSITGAAPRANYKLAYEAAVREYRELSIFAADHGMKIALEPLNPILMNVDTFICSMTHATRILEAVDHEAFGLFVDLWHLWEDSSALELIPSCADRILGVHINDWHTPRAVGDRLLPGAGCIPVGEWIHLLNDSGYRGAYTLEIFSELCLEDSLWADPRKTLQEGKHAFTQLWEASCQPA